MAEWTGQSRGNLLGYKIFAFVLRNWGVQSAYFVLYFVAAYYFLFSPEAFSAQYYYFHNRLGFGKLKSWISIYRNYYVFGQTILDKVAVLGGFEKGLTYDFDGEDLLEKTLKEEKGGILISAHIGNFEIAGHFMSRLDCKLNLVTTNMEKSQTQEYMESVMSDQKINPIYIVPGSLSHMIEISKAVRNNELVCFTGDRFMGGKTYTGTILGESARFPAGVFDLASKLKVPVIFVYAMKDSSSHYYFSARLASGIGLKPEEIVAEFCKSIEEKLNKYPLQWFNYYKFWEA
ncbi:lipid A biosynthesis acyltransferase [bacterium SCSIO 12741]|nr:lipid A biosynthesis acyltransferase [bacterium SCSIO 12741]